MVPRRLERFLLGNKCYHFASYPKMPEWYLVVWKEYFYRVVWYLKNVRMFPGRLERSFEATNATVLYGILKMSECFLVGREEFFKITNVTVLYGILKNARMIPGRLERNF